MDRQRAKDDLDFIRKIINSSAEHYLYEGIYLILWGLLIPGATAGSFILGYTGLHKLIPWLWGISIAIGYLLVFIIAKRRGHHGLGTIGGKLYLALWKGVGIGIFCVAIAFASGKTALGPTMFFLGLLMGQVYFVAGHFKPLRWMGFLAVGWWAVGLVCLWLPGLWPPAIFGGTVFLLQFFPGLYLNRQYRNLQRAESSPDGE